MRLERDMRIQMDSVKAELLADLNIPGINADSDPPTYGVLFSNSLCKRGGREPDEEILTRAMF